MINFICPFTNQEIKPINVGNYIRYNSKKYNISRDELRYKMYQLKFGELICSKNGLYDFYINKKYSIPMFKKEFNINQSILFFLLEKHGIQKRNIKDASRLISAPKSKLTLKEKYGVENISQLSQIKEKKRQTFIKNYGVDNIRKYPLFYNYIEEKIKEKYGISLSELRSQNAKNNWLSLTDEEKTERLNLSIHSDSSFLSAYTRGYNKSKLETLIINELILLNIPHQHTFLIKISNKKRYFYDVLLTELNLIIEINGDYWHANPKIYKSDDIIHYKHEIITAHEKWDRDKKKLDTASELGYTTLVLWEADIKFNKKNNTLNEFITNNINICTLKK